MKLLLHVEMHCLITLWMWPSHLWLSSLSRFKLIPQLLGMLEVEGLHLSLLWKFYTSELPHVGFHLIHGIVGMKRWKPSSLASLWAPGMSIPHPKCPMRPVEAIAANVSQFNLSLPIPASLFPHKCGSQEQSPTKLLCGDFRDSVLDPDLHHHQCPGTLGPMTKTLFPHS